MTQIVHCRLFFQLLALPSLLHWLKLLFLSCSSITLQTFAVGLVAAILKPREATLAATLYLILGAIGLPVFAGGGGGLQSFFGPSAGYLLAYPFFAFITSKLTHAETPIWKIFVAFVLGDAIVFVGGILSLHFLGKMVGLLL